LVSGAQQPNFAKRPPSLEPQPAHAYYAHCLCGFAGYFCSRNVRNNVSASDSIYTSDRPLIGKAVFAATVLVQLVLVCFIAPGLTATAIAGERERQTFELLRTTLLSAAALGVW
jgi:hypothetical protein